MNSYDSHLFLIFKELQRQGLPLGVADYLLIIEAFHTGIDLEDSNVLKKLCCLLWAKSPDDQETINFVFDSLIESSSHQEQEAYSSSSESSDSPLPPSSTWLPPLQDVPDLQQSEVDLISDKQELQTVVHALPFDLVLGKASSPYHHTKPYHMIPRLPLDRREMVGICRQLRRLQREGALEELDIEGTIKRISQTGFFLGPVLQPRRRNQTRLVLLVDQQGSMVPFSLQIDAFIDSVSHSGALAGTDVYYFHDCPEEIIYTHVSMTDAISLATVFSEHIKGSAVLIVSDAGAARGYYDEKRFGATRAFLKMLNNYTYLYAWLNPMPASRWAATTAEDIATVVPMFPLSRDGLTDAIAILQGHPCSPEIRINGHYS